MKTRFLLSVLTAALLGSAALAADNFDDALKRAATDYAERLRQASDELNRTRERIAREQAPLLADLRATEDRIIALEREAIRITTGQEQAVANKRRLLRDIEEVRKTGAYVTTLAGDALKAIGEGLVPGEEPLVADRLQGLQQDRSSAGYVFPVATGRGRGRTP